MNEIWDLKSQRSISIRRLREAAAAAANFWALATGAWTLQCQPFYDHWTVSWVYMELNIPIIIGLKALDEQKDFTWPPHLPKPNGISCRVANLLLFFVLFFMNPTTEKNLQIDQTTDTNNAWYFIWNWEWILHCIQKFYFLSRSKKILHRPSLDNFFCVCVRGLSGKQRKSIVAMMKGPLVRWPSPVRHYHRGWVVNRQWLDYKLKYNGNLDAAEADTYPSRS